MGYNLKRLADQLRLVLSNTHRELVEPTPGQAIFVMGGAGTSIRFESKACRLEGTLPDDAGPTVSIVGEGFDALEDFVEEALKDYDLRHFVGKKAIHNQVTGWVRASAAMSTPSDLAEVIREKIIKPLRSDVCPWLCLVPLVNLLVKVPVQIGSATLVSQETGTLEAAKFILDHRYAGSDVEQHQQRFHMLTRVGRIGEMATSYARVETKGHAQHIDEIAIAHTEIAINVLRAFTHLFARHELRARFGLPSEIQTGSWSQLQLGQDENHCFQMQVRSKGALDTFEVDESKLSRLKAGFAFDSLIAIAAKPLAGRNSFEMAVLQSVLSLGRSVVAGSIDQSFLGCAIALERLLIADGEETTTERFADRLALLLGRNEQGRIQVVRTAKRLYDTRSSIVHAGLTDVTDDDWTRIERLAIAAVVSALKLCDRFKHHCEFRDYLNGLKYKGDSPETV
jgi:hypothetical protein